MCPPPTFSLLRPGPQDASEELGVDLDREIPIVYQKESEFGELFWSIAPMALVLGLWLFIARRTRTLLAYSTLLRLSSCRFLVADSIAMPFLFFFSFSPGQAWACRRRAAVAHQAAGAAARTP